MAHLDVIYHPKGAAGENARWAVNLFEGCPNGCRYCYVPLSMHRTIARRAGRKLTGPESRAVFHAKYGARRDIVGRLIRDLARFDRASGRDGTDGTNGTDGTYREDTGGDLIFLCFGCDPLPNGELVEQVTAPAIRAIHASGNFVQLCSKNPTLAPWEDLRVGDELWTSLVLDRWSDQATWEPGVLDWCGDRIGALRKAKRLGLRTVASFEPVIDPEQTLRLIERAAPCLEKAMIGKLNHAGQVDWPAEEWKTRVLAIDWGEFGRSAVALCERLGLEYYVKADLRKEMGA